MSVAMRRANAPHTSMFLRMLVRAANLRRGRVITALIAMIVAAAVATAMLNLYVDVQAKLRKEFRNYGANIVIAEKDDQALPSDALASVRSILGSRGLAVPFAYVIAQDKNGRSVVVAGTDFTQVAVLDRWWSVTSWPQQPNDALLGARALSAITPESQPFDLIFHDRTIHLNPAGILHTGATEDSRIYISLSDFMNWTGVPPTVIEVAASGNSNEISSILQELTKALPNAEVRPIRQVMEGEANVLGKTRSTLYVASALIILTASLCVLATLIGWVFDRRADFAVMKALGASEPAIAAFFATEVALLGAVGAILGFAMGIAVASWIGRVNFHAPVTPRFVLFPAVFAGSIAVALIAAVVPITLLRRVQPAIILRGE